MNDCESKLEIFHGCVKWVSQGILYFLISIVGIMWGVYYFGGSILFLKWLSVFIFAFLLCGTLFVYFRGNKIPFIALLTGAVIISSSILVGSKLYDFSFDGMRGHQPAIVALKSGWNPYKDRRFKEGPELLKSTPELEGNIYVDKGRRVNSFFLVAASFYTVSGSLESGKAINLLLLICSVGIASTFFHKRNMNLPLVRALVLALNPVVLYQLFDYCLDGYVFSLYLIFLLSAVDVMEYRKMGGIFQLVAAGFLLFSSKITGVAFLASLLFAMGLYFTIVVMLRRPKKQLVVFLALSSVIVVTPIILYQQGALDYVKISKYSIKTIVEGASVRDYSRPGYLGISQVKDQNKIQRFFWSHFSETHISPGEYHLKIPGVVRKQEIKQLRDGYNEYRTGGFGPLYSLIFIVGIVGVMVVGIHKHTWGLIVIYLISSFVTFFLLPVWWARWANYLWLVPAIFISCANFSFRNTKVFSLSNTNILLLVSVFLVFTNAMLVGIPYLFEKNHRSRQLDHMLDELKTDRVSVKLFTYWFPSNYLWFINKGIPAELVLVEEESDMKGVDARPLHKNYSKFEIVN